MNRYERILLMLAAVAAWWLCPIALPAAQTQPQAEVALKAATDKETVDGDLNSAIAQYQKILKTYDSNRSVAAKALLRLGLCYEKLGDTESRKAFERLVLEYADQKDVVVEAQKHLAAKDAPAESGIVERRLWVHRDGSEATGISPDGRHALGIIWRRDSAGLVWHDLVSDEGREISHLPYADGDLEWAILSPDGKRIAYGWFAKGAGELRELSVDGSGLRTIRTLIR